MAIYPCDFAGHRFPQAQQSIYWTHVLGNSAITYKMRYCPSHFRDAATYCQEHMAMIDESSMISSSCEHCDAKRDGALYAKVFPAKSEMQQFALDLCATHLSAVVEELHVANGSPMGEG